MIAAVALIWVSSAFILQADASLSGAAKLAAGPSVSGGRRAERIEPAQPAPGLPEK